jgi:predicted RNA-binding protein Jag
VSIILLSLYYETYNEGFVNISSDIPNGEGLSEKYISHILTLLNENGKKINIIRKTSGSSQENNARLKINGEDKGKIMNSMDSMLKNVDYINLKINTNIGNIKNIKIGKLINRLKNKKNIYVASLIKDIDIVRKTDITSQENTARLKINGEDNGKVSELLDSMLKDIDYIDFTMINPDDRIYRRNRRYRRYRRYRT